MCSLLLLRNSSGYYIKLKTDFICNEVLLTLDHLLYLLHYLYLLSLSILKGFEVLELMIPPQTGWWWHALLELGMSRVRSPVWSIFSLPTFYSPFLHAWSLEKRGGRTGGREQKGSRHIPAMLHVHWGVEGRSRQSGCERTADDDGNDTS
jgi:hypothetical protein